MTLRINTNIAALNAHQNMINNDNAMTNVLQQLSSGLRINKAADDASGMAIADSLKSQSLGLGQAVKNANDGISMVQTADGALAESINIVNTIKTKSIQAAQDGQTTDSRKAIQSDITKLLQELDAIAKTTSFNGQKLLSGNFTNKQFQVGAYSGETVAVSIGSAESTKLGQISTTNLTFGGTGTSQLNLYSNLQNKTYTLASQDIQYDNSSAHGLGAVADAINKLSDVLGISAQANVASTTTSNVAAGTTDASFAINGVNIGAVVVSANDSTGALVNAINAKTDQHGVLASVDSAGNLTLSSTDGRAIQVTQGVNTTAVLGGTTNMSTLGTVQLTQTGTGQISVTDAKGVAAMTVSTADGSIRVDGKTTASDESSVLAAGSVLLSGSMMGSGTVLVGTFKVGTDSTATTKDGSVIAAGSVLASGSKIGSGTVLTGQVGVQTDLTAKKSSGGLSSSLVTGSFLSAGTSLVSGAIFQGDVSKFLSGSAAGAITVKADGNTYISGGTAVVKTGGLTLTAGAILGSGASTIKAHSILLAGSVTYGGTITTEGLTTLNANMAATKGFVAAKTSILTTGTQFVTGTLDVNGTLTGDMTLAIGSIIQDLSLVANGSTLSTADSLKLKDNETVGPKDMVLAMGSKIASGSILKAGTVLTADVHERVNASGTGGNLFKKGTTLERDIITSGTTTLTSDMTIKAGSMLFKGTTLGDGFAAKSANTDSSTSGPMAYRLSDINVTSQAGAQIGINVADAALKGLDKVRSDLGSVQNQLTSTISNLSATQVNITSAESSIRDTDFAEASSTFSRMQILVQAGSFAMAQSNASSKSVLSLLQG